MDVHCSTCGEPWDTWHLWQDAIYDTGLAVEESEAWRKLPKDQQLSQRYRTSFRDSDWEFGESLLHVRHCPCCEEVLRFRALHPDPDKESLKTAIVELLGEDEDAVAIMFEEEGL